MMRIRSGLVLACFLLVLPSWVSAGRHRGIKAHVTPAKAPQANATAKKPAAAAPKVQSLPSAPVAHVVTKAQKVAVASKATEAANAEETNLARYTVLAKAVHSLFTSLTSKESAPESYKDEFEPRCLDHVHALVARVDLSYTDMQLESNLLHQCEMERQFPNVYEDGFTSTEACKDFAKKLTEARMAELSTGSEKGYHAFCHDFYEHVYPPKKPAKKTEKAGALRNAVSLMTTVAVAATYLW